MTDTRTAIANARRDSATLDAAIAVLDTWHHTVLARSVASLARELTEHADGLESILATGTEQ